MHWKLSSVDLKGSNACIVGRSTSRRATPLSCVAGTGSGTNKGGRPIAVRAAGAVGVCGHGAGGRCVVI